MPARSSLEGTAEGKLTAPPLGPSVPRRGNALTKALGLTAMKVAGWRFEGAVPDVPKFVIIVAPHTSNWDFPVGVMALFAIGFRVSFLGKHTIFRWPWGIFMRWLGGIPVERTVSRDRVAESVAAFNGADQLILAIAPEGTRKLVPRWRTGFYHVAHGARVPIVPIYFDFATRVIGIRQPFYTTGDIARDLAEIERFFHGRTGKNPEDFQPVALPT